jgi:hypothetical protein
VCSCAHTSPSFLRKHGWHNDSADEITSAGDGDRIHAQELYTHYDSSACRTRVSFRQPHAWKTGVLRLFQARARGRYLLRLSRVFGTKSQPSLLFFTGHCHLSGREKRLSQSQAPSMHMRVSRPDDQSPKPCSFHPPLRPCRFHDGAGRFRGNRGNSAELGRCNPSSRSSWVTLSHSPLSRTSGLNPGQEALPQTPSR